MPTISQLSLLNSPGAGALWHRAQFSPHNCAPDLSATFLDTEQPLNSSDETVITIIVEIDINIDFFITICFKNLKAKYKLCIEHSWNVFLFDITKFYNTVPL